MKISNEKQKQPVTISSLIDPAFARFLDLFPIPIEVFTPNGTSVFLNRAFLEWVNIPDGNLLIGKYNVLKDPVMAQMGLKGSIQRAFQGEAVVAYDIVPPVQDLVNRGVIDEKPFERAFTDFHLYPIKNDKKLVFVVFVCVVKKLYRGRPDLARAREYIDSHWRDEFDPRAVANAVNMSERQLYNVFKQHAGMTPGDYYRKCKVEHLKEKLIDKNFSIKEAFAACGEDSRGRAARMFKKITGLSPRQFRESEISMQ